MQTAPIPTLDLAQFRSTSKEDKAAFVSGVKNAFRKTGFFLLRNHEVREEIIASVLQLLPRFFVGLPEATRLKYVDAASHGQMGYTPMRRETGEHAKTPDEKHFFHVWNGRAPYVPEVQNFRVELIRLYVEFELLYRELMRAVALGLELSDIHFDSSIGDSVMRALHYPAHDAPESRDEAVTEGGNALGMCASRHTDINMLTLLLAREPGLELFYKGKWLPVTITDPDLIIVNAGDMLKHLTGGRVVSSEHRVVCKPNVERYSVPYFGHVKGDTSLVPLAHLGPSDLEKFPFQTAQEYLDRRLEQLGLKPAN